MKKTLLSLSICMGIFYTANAQAPRMYDTATSTMVNYSSPKAPVTVTQSVTPELMELTLTLSMQPLSRKGKASERRAKRKARTAIIQEAVKLTPQGYTAKGTN